MSVSMAIYAMFTGTDCFGTIFEYYYVERGFIDNGHFENICKI